MRAPVGAFSAILALAIALSSLSRPLAQETPVVSAMADELARSMTSLRLKDQPAPYFIEYEVEDRVSTRVTARLGSLVEDLSGRSRRLRVGVRVGDYGFDSSLFIAPVGGGIVPLQADGSTTAPLDDDYDAMRHQIWLATDVAYRRALTLFARKKAAFQNRAESEVVPDFSREDPIETLLGGLPSVVVNRRWPGYATQISTAFSSLREVESSEVQVADTRGTRYYLNSEGFKVVAPIQTALLRVSADTQASDGMTLRDGFALVEKRLDDLPPVPEITARARAVGERLRTLRAAAIGEEFAGPVLLEGEASADLVMRTLVPALLGRRPPETAGRGGRGGGRGGGPAGQVTPFLRRIGLRVLTEGFSVIDTPSVREFEGRPVAGSYVVDDDGVPARDVTLVEKGRLVTLLAGRAPLRGLLQSSGHTRGGNVQPGVIQVQSSEEVPAAELKQKYLELLEIQDRDFGYIIRGLGETGGGPGGGPMIVDGVKVTLDGREEPVRGLRLGSVAPAAFRDLLEASRERTLYNVRATNTDAASAIVPNLLFEELEVVRALDVSQKPPVVPSPLD